MIEPLNDTVLVRPVKDEKSAGGIILPGNRDERATKGEIVAIGPGRTTDDGKFIPTTAKKGEVVYFHGYPTGLIISVDNVEHKLIPERQIMAKVK